MTSRLCSGGGIGPVAVFVVCVLGGAIAAAQERKEITGESYWYNKAFDRVFNESETSTHILGTIQARHNLSFVQVKKTEAANLVNKSRGLKTATEELIDWLGSTTLEFAQIKLRQYTGESFVEQEQWRAWWKTNAPYLAWSEDKKRFIVDEDAKRAGVPSEQYRKTHPWPKAP